METINSLEDLNAFYGTLPDGTTADVLSNDLETGNFDTVHLVKPDGTVLDITYTGPVDE